MAQLIGGSTVGGSLILNTDNYDNYSLSLSEGGTVLGGTIFEGGGVTMNCNLSLQDSKYLLIGTGDDLKLYHDGTDSYIMNVGSRLFIGTTTSHELYFRTNNLSRWLVNTSGHFTPVTDSIYDIGTTYTRPRNIYTDAVNVSGLATLNPASTYGLTSEVLRFGRYDNTARYHSIYSIGHSGVAADNKIKFSIHDAVTADSQVDVMALVGDGNVEIPGSLTVGGDKLGTSDFSVTGNIVTSGTYFNRFRNYDGAFGAGSGAYRSRGSYSSPTAILNGDIISTSPFGAHDGTNYVESGTIETVVNGTVSTGSVPVDLHIKTGSSGYGTERMRIASNGLVSMYYSLSVTGNISITGTVDGVDVAAHQHKYWYSHNYTVPTAEDGALVGFFVPVVSGTTVKVVQCRHQSGSGSVTAKLTKNGADLTGFTGMSVTTTATTTDGADATLANSDKIGCTLSANSSAEAVTVSITFEVIVTSPI